MCKLWSLMRSLGGHAEKQGVGPPPRRHALVIQLLDNTCPYGAGLLVPATSSQLPSFGFAAGGGLVVLYLGDICHGFLACRSGTKSGGNGAAHPEPALATSQAGTGQPATN